MCDEPGPIARLVVDLQRPICRDDIAARARAGELLSQVYTAHELGRDVFVLGRALRWHGSHFAPLAVGTAPLLIGNAMRDGLARELRADGSVFFSTLLARLFLLLAAFSYLAVERWHLLGCSSQDLAQELFVLPLKAGELCLELFALAAQVRVLFPQRGEFHAECLTP